MCGEGRFKQIPGKDLFSQSQEDSWKACTCPWHVAVIVARWPQCYVVRVWHSGAAVPLTMAVPARVLTRDPKSPLCNDTLCISMLWNMPYYFFKPFLHTNLSQKWVRKSWNELSKGLQELFFKKNRSRSHENLIKRNIVVLCIIWLVVEMLFPVLSKINMGLVVKMVFPVISKTNMEPQIMEVWLRRFSFSIGWFLGSTLVFRGVHFQFGRSFRPQVLHGFYRPLMLHIGLQNGSFHTTVDGRNPAPPGTLK